MTVSFCWLLDLCLSLILRWLLTSDLCTPARARPISEFPDISTTWALKTWYQVDISLISTYVGWVVILTWYQFDIKLILRGKNGVLQQGKTPLMSPGMFEWFGILVIISILWFWYLPSMLISCWYQLCLLHLCSFFSLFAHDRILLTLYWCQLDINLISHVAVGDGSW